MKRSVKQKKLYYISEAFVRSVLNTMESIEENCAVLLRDHPKLRDSDNLLLFHYWAKVDGAKISKLTNERVEALTPAESITRARRVLQHDLLLFLPSEQVDDNRDMKAEVLRTNRF